MLNVERSAVRVEAADEPLRVAAGRGLSDGFLRMSLPQIPPGGFDFVLMDRKVMNVFNSIDVRHRFGDYDAGPLRPGSPRTILAGPVE